MECEDKLAKITRTLADVENDKEDLEEEMHELLKRYQAIVAQVSAV